MLHEFSICLKVLTSLAWIELEEWIYNIFIHVLNQCFSFSGSRSRPTTQSGSIAIKESGDSNSATIDDANDIERIDRLSK